MTSQDLRKTMRLAEGDREFGVQFETGEFQTNDAGDIGGRCKRNLVKVVDEVDGGCEQLKLHPPLSEADSGEADSWGNGGKKHHSFLTKKSPFHSRLCQQNDRKYWTVCFRFFSPRIHGIWAFDFSPFS